MRRPLTGPRSIMRAITSPAIGQKLQCPPNQLCTAEYQRRVVGRKTKPMIGHRRLSKTPRYQWVKNQSSATTSRGVARAIRVMMKGIGQDSSRARRCDVDVDVSMIPILGAAARSSLRAFSPFRAIRPALFVRAEPRRSRSRPLRLSPQKESLIANAGCSSSDVENTVRTGRVLRLLAIGAALVYRADRREVWRRRAEPQQCALPRRLWHLPTAEAGRSAAPSGVRSAVCAAAPSSELHERATP